MRILKLQFTNLNSLAGTWCIDFTHPAYTGGGIFAITGPTGAGKSTILDAICLALYGKTPRLKWVNAGENEIMSRLTAICSSEVTFQTQGGTYRCTWTQRLAHGRLDGKRQAPMHEIVDVDHAEEILASQKGTVAAKIVEITGMDYDQFTRSMLLAQGSFAAFLQADASGRAPVLEQITGTEIYSRISMYVFERYAHEKTALHDVELELGGMVPMTEEELNSVRDELFVQTQRASLHMREQLELRAAAAWLERLEQLRGEAALIDEQWRAYELRSASAGDTRAKLDAAKKSASIEQSYTPVRTLRQQYMSYRRDLAGMNERLPDLERTLTDAERRVTMEKDSRDALKQHLHAESEVWKVVRRLDTSRLEKRRRCGELRESVEAILREQDALRTAMAGQDAELAALEVKKAAVQKYIRDFSADAALVGSKAMIDKMAGRLSAATSKQREYDTTAEAAAATTGGYVLALETLQRECDTAHVQTAEAERSASALAGEITALLRGQEIDVQRALLEEAVSRCAAIDEMLRLQGEIAAAESALKAIEAERVAHASGLEKGRGLVLRLEQEKTLTQGKVDRCEEDVLRAAAVRSLDAQRSHLVDGQPCPLCGAVEHPYSHEEIAGANEAARLLATLKAELRKQADTMITYTMRIGELEAEIRNCEKRSREKTDLIATHRKACDALRSSAGIECAPDALEAEAVRLRGRKNELQTLIGAVEKKSAESAKAAKAQETMRAALHQIEKDLKDGQFRLTQAEADEARLHDDRRTLQREIDSLLLEIVEAVAPYGVQDVSSETVNAVCASLGARLTAWTEQTTEMTALETAIDGVLSTKKTNEAVLARLIDQGSALAAEHAQCEGDLARLDEERIRAYGTKDPDAEEHRLHEASNGAEQSVAASMDREASSRNEVVAMKARIASLAQQTARAATDLLAAESDFALNLASAGFENEDDFVRALIPGQERDRMQKEMDGLRDEGTKLQSLRVQKQEEAARERERRLTEHSSEDLAGELAAVSGRISAAQQAIGSLEQRLRDNAELAGARAEKERMYAARKREYDRWNALNELIGSRDGKRFRNIAQAITFERMVALANGVLTKMSPRYYLQCDDTANLGMNIVDLYQAGEVRSTKNLSGGESFIVSLSLALGLSQMASRNVRVDSLFLDEGFGTLDEVALDTALTTLSELQQEGKCIGVISHVGALKERIATQIVVTPETGGRSRLSGPGCSAL